MKFSSVYLAALALVYAVDNGQAMAGYEGAVVNYRQAQASLNERLQSSQSNDTIVAYVNGVESQIENTIAAVGNATVGFTPEVAEAVGNYLIAPFFQAVSDGAEILVSGITSSGKDIDSSLVGSLSSDYSRLVDLAKKNNVNTTTLENLNSQLMSSSPLSKRDITTVTSAQACISSFIQIQQSLVSGMQAQPILSPEVHTQVMISFVSKVELQISNVFSICSSVLAPFTTGIFQIIGNVILSPCVETVVSTLECIASKLALGCEQDLVVVVQRLVSTLSSFTDLSGKCGCDVSRLQSLCSQISSYTTGN